MITPYEPPYISPRTWQCVLAVAELLLDVTFFTIVLAEVLVVITLSIFPAISFYLGIKPRPHGEKVSHAVRAD